MSVAVLSRNEIPADAAMGLTQTLLVDDDTNYLDLTNRWFKERDQEAYATACVHSIKQAVACLMSNVSNCVIVDFHLPDGYGTDIADRQRDEEGDDSVPLEVTQFYHSLSHEVKTPIKFTRPGGLKTNGSN